MSTLAFGAGLTLNVFDASGNYTAVEEVREVSGVEITNSEAEVTHFASTAKEFISVLGEGGEVEITCNRILSSNTNQEYILDGVEGQLTRQFQLVQTDGTNTETLSFTLAMKKASWTPAIEDAQQITFGGRVTGSITSAIV